MVPVHPTLMVAFLVPDRCQANFHMTVSTGKQQSGSSVEDGHHWMGTWSWRESLRFDIT